MSPSGERRAAQRAARVRRVRRLSRLLVIFVLAAVCFLYYRPITSYVETRDELSERREEVRQLRADKTRLEARLVRASSLAVLGREARRIGYVRPGERLFIVKGIKAWRRAQSSTVEGDG